MKLSKLFATVLLAAAGTSQAAPQTVSGVAPLAGFLGYGFSYSATWESSVEFDVSLTVASATNNWPVFGPSSYGVLSMHLTPQGSADATTVSFSGDFTVKLINLATGLVEVPAALKNPIAGQQIQQSFGVSVGYTMSPGCAAASGPVELRFSYSSCSGTWSDIPIADPVGGQIAGANSTVDVYNRAGNYLNPSNDPSCASFSCMTPGHDTLSLPFISLYAISSVGPIPEPSSYVLFTLGIAGLLAYSRRRNV